MKPIAKCFRKTAVAAVVGLALAGSGAAEAMDGMGGWNPPSM